MLSIDVISLSIGIGIGFLFYLFTAMIIAFWASNKWRNEVRDNDSLYEKKLRESGYTEDIFE